MKMPRATSWVFDVDQQRLNTNMLPGEADTLVEYLRKQLYQQPPLLNAMYNTEQRMQEIMEPPQLSAVEKSKLYSDQMNRFFFVYFVFFLINSPNLITQILIIIFTCLLSRARGLLETIKRLLIKTPIVTF